MKKSVAILSIITVSFLIIGFGVATAQVSEEASTPLVAEAVGTGFTYQGYLEDTGVPLDNATCDFQFKLFASSTGTDQVGSTLSRTESVNNGFFTVSAPLDFGSNAFNGNERFLEISVSCPTGSGSYETLSPRQAILPTPYAINAEQVYGVDGGAITLGSKSGTLYQFAGKEPYGYGQFNGGFGLANGTDLLSPIIWMYHSTDNVFQVKSKEYNSSVQDGFLQFQVGTNGYTYVRNRLGIGDQTPSTSLDIAGGSILLDSNQYIYGNQTSGDRGFIQLYNGSSGDMSLGTTHGGGDLKFTAGGSLKLTIKDSGRVGINTTAPTSLLHITSTGGNDAKVYLQGDGVDDSPSVNFIDGASNQVGVFGYYPPDDVMRFVYGTSLANTTGISINSSGQVAIGKATPQYKLDVDGWTQTEVLKITGGSDFAEPFDVISNETVEPGMVVAIDPDNPGQLRISDQAYDFTVAGCVSGANGINPGLVMGQDGSEANGEFPVALSGRVYCLADANNGAIQPGDLLTTSNNPGHAMKVTDFDLAQGAIIGKAMSSLEEGTGLILVLVTLQ